MSQRVKGKTGEMVADSGENSGKRAVMTASERKIRRSERLDKLKSCHVKWLSIQISYTCQQEMTSNNGV